MEKLINSLQEYFKENYNTFEFHASMYLAGPQNATKRQELIEYLTGIKPPKTKAGLHACVQSLQYKFNQCELF